MPEKGVNAVHKAARAITALQDFDFNFARHDVLGGPTLNVGTVKGGLNINSVPDRAAIGIDIRTIPGQSHAKIRDQLASYLGGDVALSTLLDAESVWTSPDDAWIGEVFRITRDVAGFGDKPAAAPYFTDASVLTPAIGSPPTAVIGPGELALAESPEDRAFAFRLRHEAVVERGWSPRVATDDVERDGLEWPDFLARRTIAGQSGIGPMGVPNLGIGGNRVLNGGTGEPAGGPRLRARPSRVLAARGRSAHLRHRPLVATPPFGRESGGVDPGS
jgi:hypothetical protein